MKKIYTILILLSLAGCGKKKTEQNGVVPTANVIIGAGRVQHSPSISVVDTSYYVASANYPIFETHIGIIKNGHEVLQSVQIAFTPLSGGDIGKAEGVR